MSSRGSLTGRALLLTSIVALVMITIAMPSRTWFAQRAEVASLQAQVERAREQVAALTADRARWDDPAFVTAQARRRLHMALPGETVFLTVGEGPLDPPPAPTITVDRNWVDRLLADVRRIDDGSTQASVVDPGDESVTSPPDAARE